MATSTVVAAYIVILSSYISLGLYISQVINYSSRPVGSGVDYPVREGCSKYGFTEIEH